jgi:hypothetical protein
MMRVNALREGLNLAQTVGCHRIIIGSDGLKVVETMINGAVSHRAAAVVFDDCFCIACEFMKISFEHAPREAMVVAHELARSVRNSPPSIWLDDPPGFILQILLNDVTRVYNK